MKMISEFKDGEHISGQFLVGNVSKGTNNLGSAYMSIELRDASGSINAKKWELGPDDENVIVSGNVLYVEAETLKYKDALQLKVLSIKQLRDDEIDVSKFIKQPPVSKEELANRFNEYIATIKNQDCLKIINYMLNKFGKKVYEYPAAIFIHHEYASGLLMHTVSMLDLAYSIYKTYDADYDILMSGIILHDLAKTIEFEGNAVYKYSLQGKLLGHISLMVSEIRKAEEQLNIQSEVPLLLEHMVLSHHGQPDFGSPVPPLTKEALLLSLIDNLDSKMVIVNKALDGIEPGEFSQRVFALDNRMFYKPNK